MPQGVDVIWMSTGRVIESTLSREARQMEQENMKGVSPPLLQWKRAMGLIMIMLVIADLRLTPSSVRAVRSGSMAATFRVHSE